MDFTPHDKCHNAACIIIFSSPNHQSKTKARTLKKSALKNLLYNHLSNVHIHETTQRA